MPQYKSKQMEVIRRFRDFAWLQHRLQDQNKGAWMARIPHECIMASARHRMLLHALPF